MINNNLSIPKIYLLSCLMILGVLTTTGLWAAQESTTLVVSGSAGAVTAEFEGAPCASRASGTNGCLIMKKGRKNKHFKFFFSDETMEENWRFDKIQIRELYANWGDPVDSTILDDLKVQGGGSNFFDASGEADISGAGDMFKIKDKNDVEFIIQYRISITNEVDTKWVHPTLENEG